VKAIHVLTLGCTAVLAVTAASFVAAQPGSSFDHLECYTIKDTLARGSARADLVPEAPPFLTALGCKIKLPAREYCTRSAKQNLQPPATSSVGGEEPGDYFCYRVSCPRDADLRGAALESEDQFGRRTVFVRKPKRLCVPASRTTPVPTNPTPTASPTPVGIHDPGCSFDGTECQGGCNTTGRCVYDPSQSRCICPAVFDADCGHSINQCGGQLCFGPGQQCVPVPGATPFGNCRCATMPTTTPRPCNADLFPQCGLGDCGPFSQCFNLGGMGCVCEPPTPTPAPSSTPP